MRGVSTWAYNHVFTQPANFGDDCADFASEALLNGGGMSEISPGGGSTSDDHWWYYRKAQATGRGQVGPFWSHSWSVAHDLAVHLLDWGGASLPYYNHGVQDGDLIFANWSGSSFAGISHVGVVTGIQGNGEPYITQHSPSQRNVTLQYWLTHGGSHPHVWIIRPSQD